MGLLKNPFAKKSGEQPSAPRLRPVMAPVAGNAWVLRIEHSMLRGASLVLSLASAHAIRQVFAPLDGVDVIEPVATWAVAICVGVLGYFLSRGLAYRLMNRESVWLYMPACLIVELVEVFCNYVLAASVVQGIHWLGKVPVQQQYVITVLLYVVLSAIPLISVSLAVVDMDLERKKGHVSGVMRQPPDQWSGATVVPKPSVLPGGAGGQQQYQPMGTQRNGVRQPPALQRPPAQPTVRQFNGVHPSEDVTVP